MLPSSTPKVCSLSQAKSSCPNSPQLMRKSLNKKTPSKLGNSIARNVCPRHELSFGRTLDHFATKGAHHNTLEYLPVMHTTYVPNFFFLLALTPSPRTIITGLKYPHLAASICALWVIGRIAYTRGYITGDPSKVRVFDCHFN